MRYKHLNSLKFFLAITIMLLSLTGCAKLGEWLPDQIDETEGWSAQQLYTEAQTARREGNYQTAIGYLEQLQARYPFGRYAQQAQLELIYAYYSDNQPEAAIAAADRFIKANPRHPIVDYAYYMKGVVNFSRGNAVLERLLPTDPSKTDTESAMQAYNDFAELVQKFPDSRYADDARQRMVYLRNSLAAYEVNVADFYMRRKAYLAAANRAQYVVETYPRTPAVHDALTIMVRAYEKLGLEDLAADTRQVLELNYPEPPPETSRFSLFGVEF